MKKNCFQIKGETSDARKRRNDVSEDEVATKKRKVEVDSTEDLDDDIIIIENNDTPHNTSTELKKSMQKRRKSSESMDCLIVCDDKHND